ncbi:helix-turn-helix domain-containing protein [Nocardia wallacei]|uniref:helix-turn-helix domain-containing protein n=1 Tax=Nocardia wallacei TaxID=480035 RepID=UPI0024573188|nr:helix-turn-helix domain-containing protein [Nocardia wallacei]
MDGDEPEATPAIVTSPVASFGDFVAQRRRVLELTQLDLADLADVGASSMRKLKTGQLSPTLTITARILDALGQTLVTMPPADAGTISGETANCAQ